MAKKVIVAYIPVIHQGYLKFFETHSDADTLYIVNDEITDRYRHLQKDIRALQSGVIQQLISGLGIFSSVQSLGKQELAKLLQSNVTIVMPDDEISHDVIDRSKLIATIQFYPVFLRWDRRNAAETIDVAPDGQPVDFAPQIMDATYSEALKSTNIWRRVGAALVKNGEVVAYSSNRQRPTEYSSWIDGDVRSLFGKGVGIEMSTDQHAESCVIAEAARQGISLEGADLYVTTFPCPPCSMLIAYSGIKRLYYAEGYAVLDGERILRDHNVKLFKVTVTSSDSSDETYVPYPESS